MIRFLLNQELRVEDGIDPSMTLLNYLRSHVGKIGTKEGCGSGDCGACTVVIAELAQDRLRYKSSNACLTFLAAVHGKQVITVEDLKQGECLHPAQQALVDYHGSQCGFCTPGFVMSLFALGKNVANPGTAAIEQALSGNLCRCTGYRPILAAARAIFTETAYLDAMPDAFERNQQQTRNKLRALQIAPPQLHQGAKQVFNPRTLDELAERLSAHPSARLVAGGTDLALEVTQLHRQLETLIHVGEIAALQQIRVLDDRIEIGAAASLTDCYQTLADDYPDFGALLQRFASLQIRNQATLGGNIGNASPIGDTPPALMALGAQVVLCQNKNKNKSQSPKLSRRTLTLDAFFIDYRITALQPGEFIEKVIIPRAQANGELRCYKISKRIDDDISAVLGCFNLSLVDGVILRARIAFGGMAAVPKRACHCEAALTGAPWNRASIDTAREALTLDFSPISDFRASKAYRMRVASNLLLRYFIEIEQPELDSRVMQPALLQCDTQNSVQNSVQNPAEGPDHD
ncbi:MAG: xanthine dehydrogenase small subunit [Motiliproteus sp.]